MPRRVEVSDLYAGGPREEREMYEYRATVLRVVDADTIHARVDLGCDTRIDLTIRLFGINAPEMSTAEGKAATAALVGKVPVGSVVILRTVKDRREKYGRYLGTLVLQAGLVDINQWLVDSGHAVVYLP